MNAMKKMKKIRKEHLENALTKRQKFIFEVIARLGKAGNQEILEKVAENFDKASRITVIRDLNALLDKKKIKKSGKGRSIRYVSRLPVLSQSFDVGEYFKKEPDEREIRKEKLDFRDQSPWENILQKHDLKHIKRLTEDYRKHLAAYRPAQIRRELERITIEFSWKSSHIEGNTYTLLDTERLIKEHEEAKGKTREEAVMILNHKKALEYVWNHPRDFQAISLRKIEEIHSLISADLKIEKGLRKRPVGIVGTAYKPFDNIFQIREAMESLCKLVNKTSEPFLKALTAIAGISYIQPFEDGNKRTSRLMGNAILIAHKHCPVSYRSVDEVEYKKAIILLYEQHSLALFQKVFSGQYEFAVKNYFCVY